MSTQETQTDKAIELARQVLSIEADALRAASDRLDLHFVQAVETCLACKGRIIVSGMGKSGHVAGKIASTLASTGTPSFFVHPGEASHGDLGMITAQDVVIALSNSGESPELATIVPLIKRIGAKLIAMTGNPRSTLAREADLHLDASVTQEACPLGLAPTASTTTALALGDALAVALLDARGFGKEDFARSHPGGALGRRLLVHVKDIMHKDEQLPRVPASASLSETLLEMTRKGLGMTAIVDANDHILGVFTDGDLRRHLDTPMDIRATPIVDIMNTDPRTIGPDKLAAEAVQFMEQHKINGLLVADADGRLVGAFNMHDLLRAGVV